ncbi:MAG: hypothetical protein AAGL99_17000 [Pseudomonadota bacterium]
MHRPRAAFGLTLLGLLFYAMSMGFMRQVSPIVISSSFGAILLAFLWFCLSAVAFELSFEFHARRTERKTVSLIAAVLLLDLGAIMTGGIGFWLALRLPHSELPYSAMHAFFVMLWFGLALALFMAALHIIDRHTLKRKKPNEDQAKRLPKGNARRNSKSVEGRKKRRKSGR